MIKRNRLVSMLAAALLIVGMAPGTALAVDLTHAIGFTKGCVSPTTVGDPYTCNYAVINVTDGAQDTITITAITDTVHAASGDQSSTTILGSSQVTVSFGASCSAASGTGTAGDPYIGVTSCTLPYGSRVDVLPSSFYTVQAADAALPGDVGDPAGTHRLKDTASLTWQDSCNGTADPNCIAAPPNATAQSSSIILKLGSTTTTQIHNAAHQAITTVAAGTSVHDFVTVTGPSGKPVPTGNVNIDFFTNGTCTGTAASNSGSLGPLAGDGKFDATTFVATATGGVNAFQAHYEGDATYDISDGPCESLTVADANIQLSPLTATNPVGTNHTLSCHVNVNDGTGFVDAPDGVVCVGSISGGPGTWVGSNQCFTSSGDCTLTLTSAVTGETTIAASVDVSVGGFALHRETGDGKPGDSAAAQKLWADDTVSTTVRDATNADITDGTVDAGAAVHDEASVTPATGTPTDVPDPTGSVTFTLYDNATCNGTVLATEANVALVSGLATSSTFTTPSSGGTFSYLAHYNGDANYPAHDATCETFTGSELRSGAILSTNKNCFSFVNGTAPELTELTYRVSSSGLIRQASPGTFFYYTYVTVSAGDTVSTSQHATNDAPLFNLKQGHAWVYTADCMLVAVLSQPGSSTVTYTFPEAGTYVLRSQYSTSSVVGQPAPSPDDAVYTFDIDGFDNASVAFTRM